ncbi:hypothetical protein QBC36DRAFT_384613 [Triangularia setosa]|uniref:DUF7924 domain-containing protein n=1 Tax=Triangularia setosa TaxID=2587417 RepID=A0AAN6WE69_9PEZI|nr:hypothetical protein QBC36DRAFT_384613 [Podospora setosa]
MASTQDSASIEAPITGVKRSSAPRARGRLPKQPATKRTGRNQGGERKQLVEDTPEHSLEPAQKRQRTSDTRPENIFDESATGTGAPGHATDPIVFWVKEGRWPKEIDQTLSHTTPSDQERGEKSAPYRNAQYPLLLEIRGSYMGKLPLGIADESRRLCKALLALEQPAPKKSLFGDDLFESVCNVLKNKNEVRVLQDISRPIIPSAKQCALRAKSLSRLIESINEGWNNSIPLTGTCPQSDYSLAKPSPFIGDLIARDRSLFMAT